jgi:hypothetical protein
MAVAAAAAAVVAVVGCGQSAVPPGQPVRDTAAQLTIAIEPGFVLGAHARRYELRCAPAGGTVPDPARACAGLAARPGLLRTGGHCFMPDVGSNLVSGTYGGRAVRIRLGNCGTDVRTWRRLAAVLGIPSRPAG